MMRPSLLGLLFLMCCSANGSLFSDSTFDPDREWAHMENVIAEEKTHAFEPWATETSMPASVPHSASSPPEARMVPEYLHVKASQDNKDHFKPEKGVRPLPDTAQEMLLRTAPPQTAAPPTRQPLVEILCHVDRMYVRIRRGFFASKLAYRYLTLGSCPVNQATPEHYYLLYLLKTNCGFLSKLTDDALYIGNMLRYHPDSDSPVVRTPAFNIPLQCSYYRIYHSYAVGFYPKLERGTVPKVLAPSSSSSVVVVLVAKDESGHEITGTGTALYTVGQPMYFEAQLSGASLQAADRRLYVNKCFVTASQDFNSTPKHTVIDNYGCMIDCKKTDQSRFVSHASKLTQVMRIGAFKFKDMVSSPGPHKLYMHCEVTLGHITPTEMSKACNYDSATKTWKELYGDDSTCSCCESSCSSDVVKSPRTVTPRSWVEADDDEEADLEFTLDPATQDFLNNWENDY